MKRGQRDTPASADCGLTRSGVEKHAVRQSKLVGHDTSEPEPALTQKYICFLIHTWLQPGDEHSRDLWETVQTVSGEFLPANTWLKPGVNETIAAELLTATFEAKRPEPVGLHGLFLDESVYADGARRQSQTL
jgi:hypothetical protein